MTRDLSEAARHGWTPEEEAIMRRDYADTPTSELASRLGVTIKQVWSKAQTLGLQKSARYRRSSYSGRFRPGERRGKPTEFQKGSTPHNKGQRVVTSGRSAETQFSPGNVPHNTVPVGTAVTDCDGYLKKKIADNRNRFDWQFVHRLVWEAANGPVPRGCVIVFRDGDRRNVALSNLECVSRAENMRRNSIHRYPPELKQAMRAVGKLRRTISEQQEKQ